MSSLSEIILKLNLDPEIIVLLVFLPFVVTIIGFARHVIGVKSLGIYAPIAITFMLYQFGTTGVGYVSDPIKGLKYGIFLSAIIFIITAASYKIIQDLALHYYSKISIVITTVVLSLIGLLVFADLIDREGLLQINVFSLVLIATISERYLHLIAFKESVKSALLQSIGTFALSALCYLLISFQGLQNLLFDYPLLILINYPLTYAIGRFTGLRLSEYFRFKDVLDSEE